MKKLRIILNSKKFYIILFFFLIMYLVFYLFILQHNSLYQGDETEFIVKVINYDKKDEKVVFTLLGEEKIVGTYYSNMIDEEFLYGVTLRVKGQLKTPSNNTVPNNFNYRNYLSSKGVYWLLDIDSYEVIKKENFGYRIKNYLTKRIEKIDDSGYLLAFILGNKNYLTDDDYTNYQNIGIAHLFALSGMHIGVLSKIILKMLKRVNKKLKYFLLFLILIFYGMLVGFPSSIKRCIVFFILNNLFKMFEFNVKQIYVLLLTIFSLVLVEPFIIFDIGFLYSILTVGGILYCENFIKSSSKFLMALKLSLICFLFSLPISLYSFYTINILSVAYNMFYIPLISMVIYPLAILCLFFPFLISFFDFMILVLNKSCDFFNDIEFFKVYMSFNVIQVVIFYIFLIIIFGYKKYKMIVILILMLLVNYLKPYFDNSAYISFFDVGQGDASLVITPYRKEVILIDTGGKNDFGKYNNSYNVSESIITFLKAQGIRKIDFMILTHGDYDHMGEAINLINNFKVENVIFNCGSYNVLEKNLIRELEKKHIKYFSCIKSLTINNNNFYFLQTKEYDNENDNSNVIYTKIYDYKFLLMGDAGIEKEKEILQKYNLSNIDVLKVGHHGSKTSSSKEFINVITPKYSIISVGKNNRYGHPNREVLNNLANTKIYRTDEDGSIMFKIKSNKLKKETCSP